MEVRSRPLKHYCFRIAFGLDFEALGARFLLILELPEPGFWLLTAIAVGETTREALQVAGLTLRIRATRGRSTERQRDRETERQRDRETERADLIL